MKIEEAIERLQELIEYKEEWREFWKEKGITDYRLCDTELDLEMLRMAVWALKDGMRWIPCSVRMPEMHEAEFIGDVFKESDMLLFSCATGVHCGFVETFEGKSIWRTEEDVICDDVDAWMPLQEAYSGSEQE